MASLGFTFFGPFPGGQTNNTGTTLGGIALSSYALGGNLQVPVASNGGINATGTGLAIPTSSAYGTAIVNGNLSIQGSEQILGTTAWAQFSSGTIQGGLLFCATKAGNSTYPAGRYVMQNSQSLPIGVSGVASVQTGSSPITNTTAQTAFSLSYDPTIAMWSMVGRVFRITGSFTLSSLAGNTLTITLQNTNGAGTVSQLVTLTSLAVGGLTGVPLDIEIYLVATTVSGSGATPTTLTIQATGRYNVGTTLFGAIPTTSTSVGVTYGSEALAFTAQWSVATASDTITQDLLLVEVLN